MFCLLTFIDDYTIYILLFFDLLKFSFDLMPSTSSFGGLDGHKFLERSVYAIEVLFEDLSILFVHSL